MKLRFPISKELIWTTIETQAAYQAAKASPDYQTTRIKKSDRDIIDLFYDDANNALIMSLISFVVKPANSTSIWDGEQEESSDFILNLDTHNIPEQLNDSLIFQCRQFVAYYILNRWLSLVAGDSEVINNAATNAAALMTDAKAAIRAITLRRTTPLQLSGHPFP